MAGDAFFISSKVSFFETSGYLWILVIALLFFRRWCFAWIQFLETVLWF